MELRLLGPMALLRDGKPMALPASRKTRALLAYLAVSGKPERRERLCHLFWETPDDPRGALRWSLSKLRGLFGDAIIADRETARLDAADLQIDWHRLGNADRGGLDKLTIEDLESLAGVRGEFLEGLELSRCDAFSAWCVALREDGRKWQAAICAELAGRDIAPDCALSYARAWAELEPASPNANAALVRLLDAAGRGQEAEQQKAIGIRRLNDGGAPIPAALRTTPAPAEAGPEPRVQHIHFCTASDGTGLAYSLVGDGPPLVKAANWLNHLEFDFDSPVWRHWIAAFSDGRTLLRYDERGNGLSDWSAPFSFEAFVDDLESVVDAAQLDRFDMIGISQGASVAIAYAVRHPERVRRLLIYGGYAAGWAVRANPEEVARRQAMLVLTREGWGLDNPAFRQLFTSLYLPDSTVEQSDWFNELQRMTTSPENAEELQRVLSLLDVRPLLGKVAVPTLVAHSTRDAVIPFEAGRGIAARIPGARFAAIESANHLLVEQEAGWKRFVTIAREFLD